MILIVDDNDAVATMMRFALTRHGHEVVVANDGRSGSAALVEHRPSLVLVDLGLPDVDGFDFVKSIRAELGDRTPLIAVTGAAEKATGAIDAGCDVCLLKPVPLQKLLDVVAEHVAAAGDGG